MFPSVGRFGRHAGLVAAMTLVAVSLAGCAQQQSGPETVETVKKYPAAFYDKQVTVSGEVENVFNQQAFQLVPAERMYNTPYAFVVGVEDDVLVVARERIDLGTYAIQDNVRLEVTGTVRPFSAEEIEQELGWRIDPEMEMKYAGRPVIVAQRVKLTQYPGVAWNATR